jgi:geranylgeranyl pyrophosphate synthase
MAAPDPHDPFAGEPPLRPSVSLAPAASSLAGRQAEVGALVEAAVAAGRFGPPGGRDGLAALCAAALQGGKRLRPAILLEIAARSGGGRLSAAERAARAEGALAVECIHTASLMVDDLPEFDGDRERRGRPAAWAAGGAGAARLAALVLLTEAYRSVCRQATRWQAAGRPAAARAGLLAVAELSRLLGRAARGQALEAAVGPAERGADGPRSSECKTAPFFEAAAALGWLCGGGAPARLEAARAAGRAFGRAFQIADDFGDAAEDRRRAAAGRPGWNYANARGSAAAEAAWCAAWAECECRLRRLGLWTPFWGELRHRLEERIAAASGRFSGAARGASESA